MARRHTAKFLWLRHWFSGEAAAGKTRREGEEEGGKEGGEADVCQTGSGS